MRALCRTRSLSARALCTRAAPIRGTVIARALCSRAAPIRGTVIAEQVLDGVRKDVASLQSKHGITPGLAVIVVGGRKDSLKYVQKK